MISTAHIAYALELRQQVHDEGLACGYGHDGIGRVVRVGKLEIAQGLHILQRDDGLHIADVVARNVETLERRAVKTVVWNARNLIASQIDACQPGGGGGEQTDVARHGTLTLETRSGFR